MAYLYMQYPDGGNPTPIIEGPTTSGEVRAGDTVEFLVDMVGTNEMQVEVSDNNTGYWYYLDYYFPSVLTDYIADTGVMENYGVTNCNQYPATTTSIKFTIDYLCDMATSSGWTTYSNCNDEFTDGPPGSWLSSIDAGGGPSCGFTDSLNAGSDGSDATQTIGWSP